MALPESEETRDLFFTPGLAAQRRYQVSEQRGPPVVWQSCQNDQLP
jgi:hypothetical protein